MMVELKRISTALGLLAALTGSVLAQGPTPNANQVTADSVAGSLRSSRDLAGYRIEIQARDGVVTLTGELGNPAQKAEALARTQYVAGVRSVVDQLQVSNDRSVRTVQYQPNPAQYQPNPALAFRPGHGGGNGMAGGDVIYGGGGTRTTVARRHPARLAAVSSMTVAQCPRGRLAWRVRRKRLSPAIPTTLGPAMLHILTFPRLAIPRPTRGKRGRTSDRSILIRKFRWTGGP